jgi:hypothetical protein
LSFSYYILPLSIGKTKRIIAAPGAFAKVRSVKELLLLLAPADEEKLFAVGEGNAGCSGGAGFSTTFVSVPSVGLLMTLLDKSKLPMLAPDNNIAVVMTTEATTTTINTIIDLCFNK